MPMQRGLGRLHGTHFVLGSLAEESKNLWMIVIKASYLKSG